jgi:hypothetical protein
MVSLRHLNSIANYRNSSLGYGSWFELWKNYASNYNGTTTVHHHFDKYGGTNGKLTSRNLVDVLPAINCDLLPGTMVAGT